MSTNHIDPLPEQVAAFAARAISGPVNMLNLVAFRDRAAYDDGTEATGAEAYGTYSKHAAPLFAEAGGSVIWQGRPEAMLIGPSDEAWDVAFIAAYPSKDAFAQMIRDPRYQAIIHHRTAAVRTSRLICLSEPDGRAFG